MVRFSKFTSNRKTVEEFENFISKDKPSPHKNHVWTYYLLFGPINTEH